MPEHSSEVPLGFLEVLVVVSAGDHASDASVIVEVLLESCWYMFGFSFGNDLWVDNFDLSFSKFSWEEGFEGVKFNFCIQRVRVNLGLGSMSLASLVEMRSSSFTHPGCSLAFLRPHLSARSMGIGSVSGDFRGESVEFDPEVVKSVDEIPPERLIEDILRKFWVSCWLHIIFLRKSPLVKEKTGTVMMEPGLTMNGGSDHQFYSRYFSDLSLSKGILPESWRGRLTGWRYLSSRLTREKDCLTILLIISIIKLILSLNTTNEDSQILSQTHPSSDYFVFHYYFSI